MKKLFLLALCTCIVVTYTPSHEASGLFDSIKDDAKKRIKRKTKRNLEKRVNKEVDKLVPSFETTEEVPFAYHVDLTPPQGEVAVYTRQGCKYSRDAIKFLKDNNINYKEYDIYNNPIGKAHFKALDAKGVPVILAGEERLNGYSASSLRRMLKKVGIME